MTILILYVVETKQNWRERQCLGHSLNFLMQFCPKLLQDDSVMAANTFLIWNYSYAGGLRTPEANRVNHIILVVLYTP